MKYSKGYQTPSTTEDETIYNEFVQRLGEWVCLHDEHIHFKGWPADKPLIKLCSQTLRVRANQAWKKLPLDEQECMVAHELGHREYQHYLSGGLATRTVQLLSGLPPADEIQADQYAARVVGKTRYLSFLKKKRDATPRDMNYALQLADYNHRIKALERS